MSDHRLRSAPDDRAAPPIVLAHEPAFLIGSLEITPGTRQVRGPGYEEVLEPRVMQVLVMLHRLRGQIVTRDELTRSCWDGRVIGEDAINRVIARLRRLSERDAGTSFTVETITKVGYRLAPAAPVAGPLAPEPPKADPARPVSRDHRWLIPTALGLALAAAVIGWALWPRGSAPELPDDVRNDFARARIELQHDSDDDVTHALKLLQGVVDQAPGFADGWALLAHAYYDSLDITPSDQQDGVTAHLLAALARAKALDPDNAIAKVVDALIVPMTSWAEKDRLQLQALAAVPDDRSLLVDRIWFLSDLGRRREALAMAERTAAAVPDSPRIVSRFAYRQAMAGRLEESDRTMARAIAAWPKNRYVFFNRFWIDVGVGRAQQALALALDVNARPVGPAERDFEMMVAVAKALAGRASDDVSRALEIVRGLAPNGIGPASTAILVSAELGDIDGAFAWADRLFLPSGPGIEPLYFNAAEGMLVVRNARMDILFEPWSAPMRRDPRFAALAETFGRAAYWRQSGVWPDFCIDEPAAAAVCAQLRAGGAARAP